MWFLVNIITVLLYMSAAVSQYFAVVRFEGFEKKLNYIIGISAVLLHGLALYHWIDIGVGQNLSALNLFSLVTWMVAVFTLCLAFCRPVANLGLIIFPLAAFSMILVIAAPTEHIVDTASDPRQLVHILLSMLTFSILIMAALQAMFLALQQHRLRTKQFYKLPPLETMEKLLFQLIMLGFLFLTVLLITSFYYYHGVLWQRFLQKSVFACAAWLMFAILLLGRQVLGWRGKKAVYCTLTGIGFLILTFISSSVLIGYIS